MESTPKKVSLQDKGIIFIKLLGSSFLMLLVIRIVFMTILAISGTRPKQPYLDDLSTEQLLFKGLLVAPLVESLLIVVLLSLITRFTSRQIASIVTAILFGILHIAPGVNWVPVAVASCTGYLFTHYYYQANFRSVSGFWLIVIIHSISNALSIIPEIVQFFS